MRNSNRLKLNNPVDLHLLCRGGTSEADLSARIATLGNLLASGHLGGVALRALTNASNLRNGSICVAWRAECIIHDPGVFAALAETEIAIQAIDAYLGRGGRDAPEATRSMREVLREKHGETAATVCALIRIRGRSTTEAAVELVMAVDRALAAKKLSPEGRVRGLVRHVTEQARSVDASAIHAAAAERFSAGVDETLRVVQAHLDACRPDAAAAAAAAAREFYTEMQGAVCAYRDGRAREMDAALRLANSVLGEATADAEADSDKQLQVPPRGWLQQQFECFLQRFRTDDTPVPSEATGGFAAVRRQVAEALARHAQAAFEMKIATAVAAACGEAVDRIDSVAAGFESGLFSRLRVVRQQFENLRTMVRAEAGERARRVSGIYVPADHELRRPLLESLIGEDPDGLARRVVGGALDGFDAYIDQIPEDQLATAILARARDIVRPARGQNLAQVIELLPEETRETVARCLTPSTTDIGFRPGYPSPATTLQVAVPGGRGGVLGLLIRRRCPNAQVVEASDPLLAFGLLASDVFPVDQLEGFHGEWRAAFDQARREGWVAKCPTDRRLLDLEDSEADSDAVLDALVVKGIVAERIAVSRGGTWYLVPRGELRKPSALSAGELDAVFGAQKGGGRLGASLPEMRLALRHNPRVRDEVQRAWEWELQQRTVRGMIEEIERSELSGALPVALIPVARAIRSRLGQQQSVEESTHGKATRTRNADGRANPASNGRKRTHQ